MMSASNANVEHDSYEPANGSWVAELEEAKGELVTVRRLAGEGVVDASSSLLKLHQCVCRAYCMLRQWDRLQAHARKGLAQCTSFTSDAGVETFKSSFRRYRTQARSELSVTSRIGTIGATEAVSASTAATAGFEFVRFLAMAA
jgi:hypothetical protein